MSCIWRLCIAERPKTPLEELYAEPEPENSGETAEGTESKESEGAEPSAESEATE